MNEDTTQEFPKNSLAVILTRFDSLDLRMDSFASRLTALDEKGERRLMETRPIWQQVLARLEALDTRFDSVDTRLDSVDHRLESVESRVGSVESQMGSLFKGFDRVEAEVENLSLKFRSFQGDLLRIQTRDERLAERIEKLENPPTA